MNLFLVALRQGVRTSVPDVALGLSHVRRALPYEQLSSVQTWVSVDGNVHLSHVCNPPGQIGGVVYTAESTEGFATFSGRPIVTGGPARGASGRQVLDPMFLGTTDPEYLDGRFVVCAYQATRAGGSLRFMSDALGGASLYEAKIPGWLLVSNVPAAIRALIGGIDLDPLAAASYFGLGWSLEGNPIYGSVRRCAPGVTHEVNVEGGRTGVSFFDRTQIRDYFGSGLDTAEAAQTLSQTIAALADWPGRQQAVPLSGGRDSRLIFAAAVKMGLSAEFRTFAAPGLVGYPLTEDVRLATALAAEAQVEHFVEPAAGGRGPLHDPPLAARIVNALSPGTVSLADTASLLLSGVTTPLQLVHTGQGGELGRNYYHLPPGTDEQQLVRRFVGGYAPKWPTALINDAAKQEIDRHLSIWVAKRQAEGFLLGHLGDLLYLEKRMGTWAGNVQVVNEPNGEATAPLWTRAMLRHEFALPDKARSQELFVYELLMKLAPGLAAIPFEGGNPPWPIFGSPKVPMPPKVARAVNLLKKAKRELIDRRLALLRPNAARSAVELQFGVLQKQAFTAVRDRGNDPAWEYLNRSAVDRVLRSNSLTLDARSRQYVLRLATYFLDEA